MLLSVTMNLSGGRSSTEVQTTKPLFHKPELLILNALYNTEKHKQTNKQASSTLIMHCLVVSAAPCSVGPDMVPVWRHWSRRKYLTETDAVYWLIDGVID